MPNAELQTSMVLTGLNSTSALILQQRDLVEKNVEVRTTFMQFMVFHQPTI